MPSPMSAKRNGTTACCLQTGEEWMEAVDETGYVHLDANSELLKGPSRFETLNSDERSVNDWLCNCRLILWVLDSWLWPILNNARCWSRRGNIVDFATKKIEFPMRFELLILYILRKNEMRIPFRLASTGEYQADLFHIQRERETRDHYRRADSFTYKKRRQT
jgi:hypothetical protein